MNAQKYSVEVYEDSVIIRGWIPVEFLTLMVAHFKEDGFTHFTDFHEPGFKLIRNGWMRKETVLHADDCDCKECTKKWSSHE